ncbi:MAG: HTH domain-containing protein [Candidatus Omnitrophota bacterium]|nr:HTH domain-containing protein [Candidatus Omnitrophota bacterium]MBU1929811.1 HTH domain-containing protein [Candidatus Omnitrophota bacterium]MBU2258378.1 HTH domain-containing protein [Candidatus Omnitrophota bacterium]
MVNIVDRQNRKNKVLAATVRAHIRNSQPISSQELAEEFELSSATLRNILGELEEDGYLYHPHTSAGRIPSSKGFRYYVDFLMSESELPRQQKDDILVELKKSDDSLEDILEKATEVIAGVTHYTSIVSLSLGDSRLFYKGLSNIIQEPEFRDLKKLTLLLEFLEERRHLFQVINQEFKEPLKVYIGEEIGCPGINEVCSLVVSTYHVGKKEKGRLAVLGPRRMSYEQTVSSLEFISQVLNNMLEEF